MRYLNNFLNTEYHQLFAQLIFIVCLGIMFTFNSTLAMEGVDIQILNLDKDYIHSLDLTVMKNDSGDIEIVKIGYYSPFRRYSFFRVGDVIETVNGERTTIFALSSLGDYETPWIKYRRGNDIAELQIGLEKTVYGPPDYLDH